MIILPELDEDLLRECAVETFGDRERYLSLIAQHSCCEECTLETERPLVSSSGLLPASSLSRSLSGFVYVPFHAG